jgi:hypothetical protein
MLPTRSTRVLAALAALAVVASIAVAEISPNAQAFPRGHTVRLSSTAFAAQVGSLTDGGTVYAGAVVDPKLDHGAIVVTAHGTTTLHVAFQEFFAHGSVKGDGAATLHQASNGETLTGRLDVTRGTGRYAGAHGELRITGTIDSSGQIVAAIRGAFRR